MDVLTDNPIVYSNATGARSWTKSKKRRKGWNKAAGFIPHVAVARAIQNRADNTRRPNPRRSKRPLKTSRTTVVPQPKGPKKRLPNPNSEQTTGAKSKMSNTTKYVLIGAGILAISVITYMVIKKKK